MVIAGEFSYSSVVLQPAVCKSPFNASNDSEGTFRMSVMLGRVTQPARRGEWAPSSKCAACRGLARPLRAAARLISSRDAGFPSRCVAEFFRRCKRRDNARIHFSFRVFGMSARKSTSRGASALPRSRARSLSKLNGKSGISICSFLRRRNKRGPRL